MTGADLFGKLLLTLNSHFGINDSDLIDLIETDENLADAIVWAQTLGFPQPIIDFVTTLGTIVRENPSGFLETPYSIIGNAHTIDFSQPKFKGKNRRFAYGNADYSFFSSKALIDNNQLVDFSKPEYSLLWKQIETFLERIYTSPNTSLQEQFFDTISSLSPNLGFAVLKNGDSFEAEKHYSYFYLAFLNDSQSVLLPEELKYSVQQINTNLSYDASKNYQQYFDLYDVLNELNQAPDILNRFLRLYHTLEYLVYRVYLVDLVQRVGGSGLFVREFIGSAESMKAREKQSFLKNFKKIFAGDLTTTIKPELDAVTNATVTKFLSDKNIVNGFQTSDIDKVAELIYGIRCSIVHNKESEYHLTISNSEDYQEIIPLITKLLEVFEKLVLKKVCENNSVIHYPQEQLKLY